MQFKDCNIDIWPVERAVNPVLATLAFSSRYLMSLRGHVSSVYQVAWSADSRLLVSGSSDSTIKVWDVKTGKLNMDLPGHADEVSEGLKSRSSAKRWHVSYRVHRVQVFAVDWSPDGQRVASGGKDKCLRM